MQEVKRQKNKIFKTFILVSFLVLVLGSLNAQFSGNLEVSDSLKIQILRTHSLTPTHQVLKQDFSKNRTTMPIFCKWELDIQDASKIPIKFRIGSQDYVDRLENKRTIIKD